MAITEEMMEETTETTENILLGETLTIAPENKGKSYSVLRVCCHNVSPTVSPFLNNPSSQWSVFNLLPLFDLPFVALTEMDLFPILENPFLISSCHDIHNTILLTEVEFFMWQCTPLFNFASVQHLIPHNVASSFSSLALHPNAYNQSPTINIAVSESA